MSASGLPTLPAAHGELVNYIADRPSTPLETLMKPYREFEAQLREVYAQDRKNPILDDPYLNVLPLFTKDTPNIKTRARDVANETQEQKDKYIMSLPDDKRRVNGSPATVESLKEFRHNFSVFSESSLADMDWDNVVAAGSSVVNCILPVPAEFKKSKRALREYYHERFCPASDVDLFLYGLNEEQAIEKIKDIETRIRDAILSEVTVVRTKNAITICSQYPTRHVQIVLRVYKSISEILTGFDIDCSGAAYDGEQVYTTPRALASYITQINPIDLSRRSPSYENRLSKYSHRNFEVYWPELDRSRVDPTIFERSFQRTLGLARLLVLERLPTTNAREEYLKKRREERGRPELVQRFQHRLYGNIKDIHEDEIADWVDETEVSNYHTFTVPYGIKFHAKKIEKLCYTKDLLLNAEWNQPKEREVYLHRHPAFFGTVEDVFGDCCGTCPKPKTPEEIEVAEKENEIYVSGNVSFRIDDPGRQQIGSFNPLTEDDWTEMAYVGNTARLCQAIVDGDLEHVEDWLGQEGADPNTRDYTGRTPLHLAVTSSTPAIVQCLVDHGARLVARIADGRTALHLAAGRGNAEMVKILLQKSEANEEEEEERQDQRRKAREEAVKDGKSTTTSEDETSSEETDDSEDDESDGELVDDGSSEDGVQSMATGSFVKVGKQDAKSDESVPLDDDKNDPDFYKIEAVAWDSKCSALHLAILGDHIDVVRLLVSEFGADALVPVKFGDGSYDDPLVAILTLVLALSLPIKKAVEMSQTLLDLGATSSQADSEGITAFHRYVRNGTPELLESLWENDKLGLKTAINHVAVSGNAWNAKATTPLMTAIDQGNPILVLKILGAGAKPEIDFDSWLKGAKFTFDKQLGDENSNRIKYEDSVEQPLLVAIRSSQPTVALELLDRGADPNPVTKASYKCIRNEWARRYNKGETALDVVRKLLGKLRDYTGQKGVALQDGQRQVKHRPSKPRGIPEFLSQFKESTYQHWVALVDARDTFKHYKAELEKYEEQERRLGALKGRKAKLDAIEGTISQLDKVEDGLLKRGGKTFKELHPNIETMDQTQKSTETEDTKPDYAFEFGFQGVNNITAARKQAYIELFEAAWIGDLDKIRSLTLASWDSEGQEPPLNITVSDRKYNTAFSLAFLKGHFDVARAILEIAQAQWAPREDEKAVFKIKERDDDEEGQEAADSDIDSDVQIYKEIVNDKFTIDNIGQVSMQVKSHVLPSSYLNRHVSTFVIKGEKIERATFNSRKLLTFAMEQNDTERFNFLLDMNTKFAGLKPDQDDDEDSTKIYRFPDIEYQHAIRLGRTQMLADVIRRSGAGIPLEDLVKKSGTELKIKPRYYQGLTVYGKKRADWAKKSRNVFHRPSSSKNRPPLLQAASDGSLESVEWFLSDAPLRHYSEFGQSKAAKEDPRLKHLIESRGGFDRAIGNWLGAQNDLVLHCAVLGPLGEKTNKLIEYLIKVCPSSLEAKSEQGFTPLYLASLNGRVQFAKTLIDAGADQSVKDKEFNNIVHACLANGPIVELLRQMFELFDPELRAHMFCQRNNLTDGGDTPLHFWLKTANPVIYSYGYTRRGHVRELADEKVENVEILRLILEFSKGKELEILNGSGDTVLHTAVVRHLSRHVKVLLEQKPKVLYRENTVGRTPAEIAYDAFINSKVQAPDSLEVHDNSSYAQQIVDREPESFDRSSAESKKPRTEATWELVQEYLAKVPGERRLVSLNEANDVARRLGESYSWQRYFSYVKKTPNDDEMPEEERKEEEKETDFIGNGRRGAWRVEKNEA
ncbi:ankyrin repeat protein [Xylariaceae sp. FL1272]|nr:ankyrin repeat protein [Xylariaceae sp. FL1272]